VAHWLCCEDFSESKGQLHLVGSDRIKACVSSEGSTRAVHVYAEALPAFEMSGPRPARCSLKKDLLQDLPLCKCSADNIAAGRAHLGRAFSGRSHIEQSAQVR